MIKQFDKNNLKLKNIVPGILIIGVFVFSYLLGLNLTIPAFLSVLCIYFSLRKTPFAGCNLLYLSLLFLVVFTPGYLILKQQRSLFYIPFSVGPMLAALLFNSLDASLLLSLAISFCLASISHNPFLLFGLSLTSSLIASLLVIDARKRTTIIRAGLLTGVYQLAFVVLLDYFLSKTSYSYPVFLANGIMPSAIALLLNGILSSFIVLGALPLFEYLFNTVTNISLLELADFNHPLLQRMTLEAPGTYHHSLLVGNLSESACRAIGANALLARIGAYYHDIGKLSKPDYFSENQDEKTSRHSSLSPHMSKIIIMNHVKEGVELARKYKLNSALIDFIQQHHGNSLVYYFYRRALELLEEDQQVKEEGFRYPGPKPDTKETAIVLLADSVEAATRALKDPEPNKIEEVVHKIINNKFIDGQLDECELALKDLEKISTVFIRILSGIYHSRVSYSEEGREDIHKKLPKETNHQPIKDKKSNP
jgi:putative nucleotidyltransferase with HDIG domain